MTNLEFVKRLEKECGGNVLKLTKHIFYVLSYGASDRLWLVIDGVIITERNNSDGTQIGCGVYGPGMLVGITALNNESGVITCKPLKDTTVMGIRTKDLLQLMREDHEISMYVVQFLCNRFRFMMNSLEMNSVRSVQERISYFEKMIQSFDDPELFDFGDNVVAEYLGIHPASISRARKQMYIQENKDK